MAAGRSRLHRSWAGATLVGLLATLTAWQVPAHAYEADTHYAWTYYLALHLGCTRRQAYQVASAAFAIDMDPNTSPMEAGAVETIRGKPNPRLKGIWTRFHAFLDHEVPAARQEAGREAQKASLRALSVRERNPGPLIHYSQDFYSHGGWDSARGHAKAGHQPDFLSTDPAKSRKTTDATLAVIGQFMSNVLGQAPAGIDAARKARIYEVLDALVKANPYPSRLNPSNYDWTCRSGVPIVPRAVNALNSAIEEDQRSEVLPRCLDGVADRAYLRSKMEFAASPDDWLPGKWIPYEYNGDAQVVDRKVKLKQFYAVETAKLEVLKHEVKFKPVDAANSEITVKVHYRLSGLRAGLPFLDPLPVVEMHKASDFLEPKVFTEKRGNGDHVSEFTIQRPNRDVDSGNLKYKFTVYAHDLKPIERDIPLKGGGLQRSVLFLVDGSGSMGGARIAEARKAVADLIQKSADAAAGEEWAILSFSNHNVYEILPFTTDAAEARKAAERLQANGDTPLRYGQAKAITYLLKNGKASEGQLIILCDGDDNCPGPTCRGGAGDPNRGKSAAGKLQTIYKTLQLRRSQ